MLKDTTIIKHPHIWLFFFFQFCLISRSDCQKKSDNYYSAPLLSQGIFPDRLNNQKFNDRTKTKSVEEKFKKASLVGLNEVVESGRILYGDEITAYLNKVADKLLENNQDLRNKLSFYTFKSSSVNASCISEGVILVNVGLIAYLETEAELAFVLAHEIEHFEKKHAFSLFEKASQLQLSKTKSKTSFDTKLDALFARSKEHETEADSLGFERFIKTKYNQKAALRAFDMLHYSYLPYENEIFDPEFLNTKHMLIPRHFFLDTVKEISTIGKYDDRYLLHPHIIKRKELVARNLINEEPGENFIVGSEGEFNRLKEIARFECVRLDLLRREYGNAIYNSFVLLQKHPDDEFLLGAICKALYGLSKYSNESEFYQVARPYSRIEGQSQSLHYLLKTLDRKQLNAITINMLWEFLKKHDNGDEALKMIYDLIEDLTFKEGINFKEYFFNSNRDAVLSDKEFHRGALVDLMNDEQVLEYANKVYDQYLLFSKQPKPTRKQKKKADEQAVKKIQEEGLDLSIKQLTIVDLTGQGLLNEVVSLEKKLEAPNYFSAVKNLNEIEVNYYCNEATLNTLYYNQFSILKEWLQERLSHDEIDMIPLMTSNLFQSNETETKKWLLCTYINWDSKNEVYFYNNILFDTEDGMINYNNRVELGKKLKQAKVKDIILEDLKTITK